MAARAPGCERGLGSQREGRSDKRGLQSKVVGGGAGGGRERGSQSHNAAVGSRTAQDWPVTDPPQKQKPLLSWGQGLGSGVGPG